MAASKKSKKIVQIIVIVLAVIGAWTVVDNTTRLGQAVWHTVTSFHFAPVHFVQAK